MKIQTSGRYASVSMCDRSGLLIMKYGGVLLCRGAPVFERIVDPPTIQSTAVKECERCAATRGVPITPGPIRVVRCRKVAFCLKRMALCLTSEREKGEDE